MYDHAVELTELLAGVTFDQFMSNRVLQHASVRLLEIIGEAANLPSPEVRTDYPFVPWRKVIDVRNVIAHAYGLVDYEVVWQIVRNDVPNLISQLEHIRSDRLEP